MSPPTPLPMRPVPKPKKTVTFAPQTVTFEQPASSTAGWGFMEPPIEYVNVPATGLDKLLLTAAIIVPLAVWIWGIVKFHQCGSGWVMAGLKQLGVHVGVGVAYGAIVAAIVSLLSLWATPRATSDAGELLKPWGPKGIVIMHTFVAAVTFIIFKDRCRF